MSGTILDELAAYAAERVAKAKMKRPLSSIRADAEQLRIGRNRFSMAIRYRSQGGNPAFICECKKASPSKGLIAPEFPYLQIAEEYEEAGADCISVLTEPRWFLGSDLYLQQIAEKVHIPCLRKDFTVDPYMIYEAKLLGASAVLLIVALLDAGALREYLEICEEHGLDALVEAHDESEIQMAARVGAKIIGVNNRNLKDFSVDTGHAATLRRYCPPDSLFVVESGIQTPMDILSAKAVQANAVLIGEALMRAPDKAKKIAQLRSV